MQDCGTGICGNDWAQQGRSEQMVTALSILTVLLVQFDASRPPNRCCSQYDAFGENLAPQRET